MKKNKNPIPNDVIDTGTDEIHKRRTVVPKLTRGMSGYNFKVMDETEVDRLLLREAITPNQHSTLERFLAKLQKVGFSSLRSPDYSSPIHADAEAVGDKKALALKGITALIEELDESVGIAVRVYLVALVTEDREWPHSDDTLRWAVDKLDRALS
jgi:hypothetical protein